MTAICPRCERSIHEAPPLDCSAATVHRAAAIEIGRYAILVATVEGELQAGAAIYASALFEHIERLAHEIVALEESNAKLLAERDDARVALAEMRERSEAWKGILADG